MLVLGLSEFAYEPYKSDILPFPKSFLIFLGVFHLGFQSQVFWGLVSPMHDLDVWVLDVELESLGPQGKDPYLCDPF